MKLAKLISLFIPILLFLTPYLLHAQDISRIDICNVPSDIRAKRPNEDGPPVKIQVGFNVLDLIKINDFEQTFTIDILYKFYWTDSRLSERVLGKSLEDCVINKNKIWFPKILDINLKSGEEQLEEVVHIDTDGNILYVQRLIGTFYNDLDYRNFPFDSQILNLIFASYDYGPTDVEFQINQKEYKLNDNLDLEGWTGIKIIDPLIESVYIQDEDRHVSKIELKLQVTRDKQYYIWKMILPLCLIVLMAWAVFWIPPSAIGPQIGLSTATVFTLIAYRFSIGFQLPKISYFTKLDIFVFLSTILVFLALGTAISTSNLASKGEENNAVKIEKYARIIYLILFLIIIFISFSF